MTQEKPDIQELYNSLYKDNPALLATVLTHSESVARKALECIEKRTLEADREFVWSAALLHDIGVVRCNAPSIDCHGSLPYICHGIEGARILRDAGFERHARVCERHTGAGLSANEIITKGLPLPHKDFIPETLEEKLICYADKFFSKSGELTKEKPFEKVIAQMAGFGRESLETFLKFHNIFG